LKNLKSQYFDSKQNFQDIIDYYIILCFDLNDNSLVQKQKIIETEFSKTPNVHIIEPDYALTFLNLSEIQIDSIIKSKIGSDDIIHKYALEIINNLTPTERGIIYYLLMKQIDNWSKSFTYDDLITSTTLQDIYEATADYERDWYFITKEEFEQLTYDSDDNIKFDKERDLNFEERVQMDVESLKDNYLYITENKLCLDLNGLRSIITLMLDGSLRYEYWGSNLILYMMNLFPPPKGFNFEIMENNISY